jgi:hypothetical protein
MKKIKTMINRYDVNGELNQYGEFVKMEDVQKLVDFLYEVMSSNADVAIDMLVEHGEELLEKWQ